MQKKIRVAIVGAGGVARGAHAPAYAQLENVTLVAVCDLIKEKADSLAAEHNAKPYYQLAFTRSISAFVNSVRRGKTPPVTGEDGFRALLIEEAIVVSQAQKSAVTIANGKVEKSLI